MAARKKPRRLRTAKPVICASLGLALSEPTDDRKTLATADRQNFVKRLGSERDQQTSFTFETESHGLIRLVVKIQNTAAETALTRFN